MALSNPNIFRSLLEKIASVYIQAIGCIKPEQDTDDIDSQHYTIGTCLSDLEEKYQNKLQEENKIKSDIMQNRKSWTKMQLKMKLVELKQLKNDIQIIFNALVTVKSNQMILERNTLHKEMFKSMQYVHDFVKKSGPSNEMVSQVEKMSETMEDTVNYAHEINESFSKLLTDNGDGLNDKDLQDELDELLGDKENDPHTVASAITSSNDTSKPSEADAHVADLIFMETTSKKEEIVEIEKSEALLPAY